MNPYSVGMNMHTDRVDVAEERVHRPPNAFLLYIQTIRQDVREQNPSLSNLELSQLLGSMWKSAPEEVRKKFKEEAARLQQAFKEQHPEYCYKKTKRVKVTQQKKQEGNPTLGVPPNPALMYQQMFQYQQMQQIQMFQQMQQMPPVDSSCQFMAPSRERQPRTKRKAKPPSLAQENPPEPATADSASSNAIASLGNDIWDDESIY